MQDHKEKECIVEGIRSIEGHDGLSEEECLEVWEFAMELQERCELYIG